MGNKQNALWHELRERMEASQLRLNNALNPDMKSFSSVMELRAHKLAEPIDLKTDSWRNECLLFFACGGERYAIAAGFCAGVVVKPQFYPLPGASSQLLGITSYHGNPLPLFDSGANKEQTKGKANYLLVLGELQPEFAIIIDDDPVLNWELTEAFSNEVGQYEGPFQNAVCSMDEAGRLLLDGDVLLASRYFNCEAE